MNDEIKQNSVSSGTVGVYTATILIAVAFLVGFFIGDEPNSMAAGGEAQYSSVSMDPFWKVWNVLDEKFVPSSGTSTDAVSDEDRIWGAISGLASSYSDPYTVFLPPSDNEVFESDISGNFEGVGMEIGIRNGVLTVISPLAGTPAKKAGIKAGDKIIKIDGMETLSMSTHEAVKLIRGERGTQVVMTVLRNEMDAPMDISIKRDKIDIPTITSENRADGIFVITLYNFNALASDKFRDELKSFVESGRDKLILDLRGNPGGFLQSAIDMASWFLPGDKVVVSEHYGEKREDVPHRSRGYDIFNDELKMVVLIDQGSASASEILAGALRDHGVATLVGERSFGKGSVQELVEITPETSLKVTIARWMLPDGQSISEKGVEPDIRVEITEDDEAAGRDPQMEKAVEVLNNL